MEQWMYFYQQIPYKSWFYHWFELYFDCRTSERIFGGNTEATMAKSWSQTRLNRGPKHDHTVPQTVEVKNAKIEFLRESMGGSWSGLQPWLGLGIGHGHGRARSVMQGHFQMGPWLGRGEYHSHGASRWFGGNGYKSDANLGRTHPFNSKNPSSAFLHHSSSFYSDLRERPPQWSIQATFISYAASISTPGSREEFGCPWHLFELELGRERARIFLQLLD